MNISDTNKTRIKLIYGIVTSVMIAALGVLFITSAYGIYSSGPNAFTRESVGAALTSIIVPIIISVVLIIGGFILSIVFPGGKTPARAFVTDEVMEERLLANREISANTEIAADIEKERRKRSLFKLINIALTVVGIVAIFVYALNPEHYSDNLNKTVIDFTVNIVITMLPSLVFASARLVVNPLSYKKEIELLKALPKSDNPTPVSQKTGVFDSFTAFLHKNEAPIVLGVRIALVLVGVVYITLGVLNGGMSDVLEKAIKICTECIGLG